MKTRVFLGLVTLGLLLVAAFHRSAGTRHPVPAEEGSSVGAPLPADAGDMHRPPTWGSLSAPRIEPRAGFVASIEGEPDPERRMASLDRIMDSVTDGDLRPMLDLIAPDDSRTAAELRKRLVRRWAERDTPAAAAWITPRVSDATYAAVVDQVAIAWANSDLSAATAWVHRLPEGNARQAATAAIAYEAARGQPVAALAMASGLRPTPERDDLLVHAIRQLAATDFTSAAAWALRTPDPDLRVRMVAAVAIARATQDGVTAATFAVDALMPGDEKDRATISIVQRWAQNSPQAAAAWVARSLAVPLRDVAARHLLSFWTRQDAETAGEWLLALPAGSLRNAGAAAYVEALADRDGDRAR